MKTPKKPPPDNVGNLRGRIHSLLVSAHQNAKMEAKEGGDYERVLAKEMKQREPQFKNLRIRLAKVQKMSQGAPVSTVKPKKSRAKPAAEPQEPSKKRSAGTVPADYDDLLAALGGL